MTDFQSMSPQSRVWIYQSDQAFSAEEEKEIRDQLAVFAQQWVSHNQQLRAHADVWHRRFIILMVDESQAGASGCSIDSSVRFLQQLQNQFKRDFFDRMRFSYQQGQEVYTLNRADFARAYQLGQINDTTLVFDTLVKTKQELESVFTKPLAESWHARMV